MPLALRTITWLFGALALLLAAQLLWPDRGLWAWQRERAQLEALERELAAMRRQVEALREEVKLLRHDPVAIEAAIHRELGYLHPDEIMVIRGDDR